MYKSKFRFSLKRLESTSNLLQTAVKVVTKILPKFLTEEGKDLSI